MVAEQPLVAYVANELSGTVSIVDLNTNSVTRTFLLSATPRHVAVSPDGRRLYVTVRSPDGVLVMDALSGSIVDLVTDDALDAPEGILLASTATGVFAYVANLGSNTVSVIDAQTGAVVSNVPVGMSPTAVAVNPGGNEVYATNSASGTVSVIETATNQVASTIAVGPAPVAVSVRADGRSLYVADFQSADVSLVDLATGATEVVAHVGGSPVDIALSPSGTLAYVTTLAQQTLAVIGLDTVQVDVGALTAALAITPDGSAAYVTTFNSHPGGTETSDVVAVINTADNTLRTSIPVGRLPTGITIAVAPVAPTDTPSPTLLPTSSPTATPTVTLTGSPTTTPTITETPTITDTPTSTATATETPTPIPCGVGQSCPNDLRCIGSRCVRAGDCDNSGIISVEDFVTALDVFLGTFDFSRCEAGDFDLSGDVTLADVVHLSQLVLASHGPVGETNRTPIPSNASVIIGSVSAVPGEAVQVAVTITTAGASIAAIVNDIVFAADTPILAREDGQPDCTVNPAVHSFGTFGFLPFGCVGSTCTSVRALVGAEIGADGSIGPIADGSGLYTCTFAVSPSAFQGSFGLVNADVAASDSQGNPVSVGAEDGRITVGGGIESTATPTTTVAAFYTPTPTPTSPGCSNDAQCAPGYECAASCVPTNCGAIVCPEGGECAEDFGCHAIGGNCKRHDECYPRACIGDCDADGHVDVEELLEEVNLALGRLPHPRCGDLRLGIADIIAALRNAPQGCR